MTLVSQVAAEALSAIRLGQVVRADEYSRELPRQESAWGIAVKAARWHAAPDEADVPVPTLVDGAEEAWALSHLYRARAQLLAFDIANAQSTLAAAGTVAESLSPSLRERLAIEGAFVGLFAGRRIADLPLSEDPDARIDAAVARALHHGEEGSMKEAIRTARRASRMARAEGAPQREYLANLALARIRRIDGFPHLAARILTAIERVASRQWLPWVHWEMLLAGGSVDGPVGPARHLSEAASALREGAAPQFRAAIAACMRETESIPLLARDVMALAQVLDPQIAPRDLNDDVRPWCLGETNSPPRGLSFDAGDAYGPFGYVASDPAGARRVLGGGIRLSTADENHRHLEPGRVEGLLAALLLAPEGIEESELFEQVYGFAFRPSTHQGALRVALTRAKQAAADVNFERKGDRLRIQVGAPLVVHDPRCERSIHDRVLHVVASGKSANARSIAAALGVPLRNAQRALAALVEDGHCARNGRGPATAYVVEDTTFSEPTSTDAWRPVNGALP